ncbi:MAG: hypothetical protein ACTSVU_05405 [Promethearchaeota archaeon]
MEEKLDGVSVKLEELKTLFTSALNKVNERDDTIKNKDARIAELTDKLVIVSKEKDEALWAKIDLMKAISQERDELHDKINELKEINLTKEAKIKKLKAKSRQAQDGLMGSSFEMDRMKQESIAKDKKLEEFKEKAGSVAKGSTGILYDIQISVDYVLDAIKKANRSLRIVAPTIQFMDQSGITEALNSLPENCVVNIATSLDIGEHAQYIDYWKNRGWYVYNYQDENFLMVSVNGADVCIGYTAGDIISGFYSNISDLVILFKQALMFPYIKGQKL